MAHNEIEKSYLIVHTSDSSFKLVRKKKSRCIAAAFYREKHHY